ncbi:TonB-dependent receptor [Emcibacter sp.]|uniref:TonB-dependent receptor n=1 Tax=Emcibacter sp. TaxID=1979954 RepID=UPI003A8F4E0B
MMSSKFGIKFMSTVSVLAVLAVLAWSPVAYAQEEAEASRVDNTAPQRAEVLFEEIIVTATRRKERIHDVPGTVNAVSADLLNDMKAKNLVDFAAFTPGVSFQASSPGSNKIVIRGVTTGGTQLNSAIGLYLDDVPIGSSTPFGAGAMAINVGLFDLQRVEVLSGPQGTLFGANALGGTMRYITETPSLEGFSGQIAADGSATANSDVGGEARLALNTPLGDKVALRVVGTVQNDPGFVDDPSHDRENLGDVRMLHGRAALLFEATSDISIQLNGFAERIRSNGYAVSMRDLTTHQPTEGAYDQSFASLQPSETELYLGSGVIHWALDWADLTSITAYQKNRLQGTTDLGEAYSAILGPLFGPAGVNPYVLLTDATTKRFTQEVRLASVSGGAFDWVAGAFYSNEKTFQIADIRNNADANGLLFGLPIGRFDLPSTAKDFALFGNATVHVSQALDMTVGARQTWSDQVFSSSGIGAVVNPFAPTTVITARGTSKESVQTYLFNLRYRPTTETMVYARVASGYRPGGPNLQTGGSGSGNETFSSDKLWNYEIGLKQTLTERGFVNISAYHIDWTNIQQVRNIGGVNQLVNGGDARVNGAEVSLSYRIIPRLNVLATGAYTDAKLTTVAPVLDVHYTGARLPLSPKFSFALAASYNFDVSDSIDGTLNLSLRHNGKRNAGYVGSTAAILYELDSYTIVDAILSMRTDDGWEISPYIKNVFNVRGEVSAVTVTNQFVPTAGVPVTLSRPRTVGLAISKQF